MSPDTSANGELKTRIHAVVFDYGEVIALSDAEDWAAMVKVAHVAGPVFADSYWRYRLDYDRGMSVEAYWAKVAQDSGAEFTEDQVRDLTRADAAHWTHLDEGMLAWIQHLKGAGKKIGMISNMPLGIAPVIRELPFAKAFDSLVFSCDLKLVKPSPEIYNASLKELGVRPSEALFLDDKPYNVVGARDVGMHGILFDSLDGIQQQLDAFDLPLR